MIMAVDPVLIVWRKHAEDVATLIAGKGWVRPVPRPNWVCRW